MEFIKGITLHEYLNHNELDRVLSKKVIDMLKTFQDVGFERLDNSKGHIFIQPDGSLRAIDLVGLVELDHPHPYPYPRKFLKRLDENQRKKFLSHAKEIDPILYEKWNRKLLDDYNLPVFKIHTKLIVLFPIQANFMHCFYLPAICLSLLPAVSFYQEQFP